MSLRDSPMLASLIADHNRVETQFAEPFLLGSASTSADRQASLLANSFLFSRDVFARMRCLQLPAPHFAEDFATSSPDKQVCELHCGV